MGKPKAPAPPDYAAAAREQGTANVNSAIAGNFLNQADQKGPYGSLKYTYDYDGGMTLPDGTRIPRTMVETILSPDQQKLLDQNSRLSISMNDLAGKGLDYVGQAVGTPIDRSGLPSLRSGLATPQLPNVSDFQGQRDKITDAMMQRLQPYLNRQRAAMDTKLANQGITNGSEAWKWDQDTFNRGENDQRIAALLAGDQAQQDLFNNSMSSATTQFNMGLAGGQFDNQARQQAIQEQDYFRNQPLNMLNALRSGNQVNMPQFGNVSAGSGIAPAPVYQATADSYDAAMQKYKADLAARGGLLGGIASLGGAAIGKWG